MNKNNEPFNEEYLKLEEWVKVVTLPEFVRLKDYIEGRIKKLLLDKKQLVKKSPTLDSGVEILSLQAREEELEKLLHKFEWVVTEKKRIDRDKQTMEGNHNA